MCRNPLESHDNESWLDGPASRLSSNFRRFINAIRIERARLLMQDPKLTLTEVCDACGYTNMRIFRRAFQAETGCLPSEHAVILRSRVTGSDHESFQAMRLNRLTVPGKTIHIHCTGER